MASDTVTMATALLVLLGLMVAATEGQQPNDPSYCGLRKDRGSCSAFEVRWYYDTEYGGCLRFWYGGCAGNGNRFSTEQECTSHCVSPPGDSLCYLPAVRGACKRAKSRWFSDPSSRTCRQFTYSGCLGNDNRFESETDCQERCRGALYPSGGGRQPEPEPEPQPSGSSAADCLQSDRDTGTCDQWVIRYSWLPARQQCAPFYYGGCGGNANNFDSQELCESVCKAPQPQPPRQPDRGSPQERTYVPPPEEQPTEAPYYRPTEAPYYRPTEAPYYRPTEAPYYRPTEAPYYRPTEAPYYRPTEAPYYRTSESPHYEQPTEAPYYRPTEAPHYQQPTEAPYYRPTEAPHYQQPTEAPYYRPTEAPYHEQPTEAPYYRPTEAAYNEETTEAPYHRPTEAPYNEQTTEASSYYQPTESPHYEQSTEYPWPYHSSDSPPSNPTPEPGEVSLPELCYLPEASGPCRAYMPRFFYSAERGICLRFIYTGCGGNANSFGTLEECEATCASPTQVPDTIQLVDEEEEESELDVCSLPPDQGPCRDNKPRFYYNAALQSCYTFYYGGCEGNGNRFASAEECANRCQPDSVAAQPSEPATHPPPVVPDARERYGYDDGEHDAEYDYGGGEHGGRYGYDSGVSAPTGSPSDAEDATDASRGTVEDRGPVFTFGGGGEDSGHSAAGTEPPVYATEDDSVSYGDAGSEYEYDLNFGDVFGGGGNSAVPTTATYDEGTTYEYDYYDYYENADSAAGFSDILGRRRK